MKQPLSLEVLHTQALNSVGCSATLVPSARRIYIVGGVAAAPHAGHDDSRKKAHTSPYLSVHSFDLDTIDFTEVLVNASGQYNVAFHASVVVDSDILTIGGRLLKSHIEPQLNGSLIRIRDSDFGIGCKVLLEDPERLARQGHCAHAVGAQGGAVLVFGGFSYADPASKSYSKVYRADACIIEKVSVVSTDTDGAETSVETWAAVTLETSGAPPQGRAYFSSCILSSDSGSSLLLVHGGKTASDSGATLLDDLWILEVTKSDATWVANWSPVLAGEDSTPLGALQCHKMFPLSSFTGGTAKLCVFGGLNDTYDPLDDFFKLSISKSSDGLYSFVACEKGTNNNLGEGCGMFYNFGSAIAPIYDTSSPESPSCVCVFGGVSDGRLVNGAPTTDAAPDASSRGSGSAVAVPCLMVAVDNSSSVVALARKCLRDRGRDGDLAESSVTSQLQLYDRLSLADGSSYEGETVEEQDGSKTMHGAGKLTRPDGSELEGCFVRDLLEGSGRHVDAPRSLVYEGAFVGSVYCGGGRLTRAGGGVLYVGDFLGGVYHGRGVLHSLGDDEGGVYEGDFDRGCRSGQGRISYSCKPTIMSGTFVRDVMVSGDGQDLAVENDNRPPNDRSKEPRLFRGTYCGQLKHCKPHGQGRAVWEDGCSYEGGWINGTRGGLGRMVYRGGCVYEGKMKGDLRCGGGRWVSAAGNESYSGQWLDGDIDGFGVYNYSDGGVYEGVFKKGMKNQSGRFARATIGSMRPDEVVVYEGSYYNDQRHGHGSAEYADGSKREGLFEFDEFVA